MHLRPNDSDRSRRKSPDPVLILLDGGFRPVSYSTEAIRVLTYPQTLTELNVRAAVLEEKLNELLSPFRIARQAVTQTQFQSGRRRYCVRLFKLNSGGNSRSNPSHALMLERQERRALDIAFAASFFRLTAREQETLGFLVQGMTSKEIAVQMGVSPHTVKAFLHLVMSKMQVSTRSGIVGKLFSTIAP